MSLEHLDSEFLYWRTFQKLFMFILMSFTRLISHKMALFLKKVKILWTEKLAFFTVTLSWARSFEQNELFNFHEIWPSYVFLGVECNDVVFEVMRLRLGSVKASQHK